MKIDYDRNNLFNIFVAVGFVDFAALISLETDATIKKYNRLLVSR